MKSTRRGFFGLLAAVPSLIGAKAFAREGNGGSPHPKFVPDGISEWWEHDKETGLWSQHIQANAITTDRIADSGYCHVPDSTVSVTVRAYGGGSSKGTWRIHD